MKQIILALILMLGCSSSGIYEVRHPPFAKTIGVAVSTESLISVVHPPYIGQKLQVLIRGEWIPVKVTRVGPEGIIELRAIDGELDLQPGDSGSPVAIIIGKKSK